MAKQLKVSSPDLDSLVSTAQKAGSLGATVSGAGGGDCVLAVVDQSSKAKVVKHLISAKAQIINVSLNAPGVRIENG